VDKAVSPQNALERVRASITHTKKRARRCACFDHPHEKARRDALKRVLRKNVTFLRYHFDRDEQKVDALFPPVSEVALTGRP